ncbi:MAG: hypothetical protein IAE82_14980 [Opitutaceae bacterium]|nr:hypothetical protein [Opitutaceae bacterium]
MRSHSILLHLSFAAALAVSVLPHPTHAQWSGVPGINNPVVVDTSINPQEVVMVSDGAGGAAFLWRDHRAGVNDSNLYAQRLDANGARMWGDNGSAICALPGHVDTHAMVPNGAGGFYLAWVDQRTINATATRHVWLQRLDADGEAQWEPDGRLLREFGSIGYTNLGGQLLADGAGGLYVFTSPQPLGTTDYAQRLWRLTADGQPPVGWPGSGLDVAVGYVTYAAALITDQPAGGSGEHGVVLILITQGGGIIARRVTAAGALGFSVPIDNYFGTYGFKGACSDGQGGAFIVTGSNADLYYLHLQADGTLAWPENNRRVALPGGVVASGVTVVSDGAGGAIVTWLGSAPGSTSYRMTAQHLGADGSRQWGDLGVEVHDPGAVYAGAAVSDGAGGVIVTWGVADPSQVRAQRLDAAGSRLWPAAGVLVSEPWGLTQLVTDQASGAVYSVVAGSGGGGTTFGAKRTTLTGTLGSNTPSARLANISARAQVGGGSGVLIPGFVVSGGSLQLLVRGVGPRLAGFGVGGVLPDPQLSLVNGSGVTIATNDDWGSASNLAELTAASAQVYAFGLGSGSKDAAMLVTLPPGLYTAVMSSAVAGETGVGLVELYEIDGASAPGRLANMSVRAQVGTGEEVLIPGIVVGGTGARTLLVRAVGPRLASFGVAGALANPTLTLFSGSTAIGTNDNWSTPNGTQIAAVAAQVYAFSLPNGSADAALLVTLAPGTYTAQVSGVGGTTGVCLVEVYEVP